MIDGLLYPASENAYQALKYKEQDTRIRIAAPYSEKSKTVSDRNLENYEKSGKMMKNLAYTKAF
jgi:hypothetical protein